MNGTSWGNASKGMQEVGTELQDYHPQFDWTAARAQYLPEKDLVAFVSNAKTNASDEHRQCLPSAIILSEEQMHVLRTVQIQSVKSAMKRPHKRVLMQRGSRCQ